MILRTCIVTNEKLPQNELIRIVRVKTPDGFTVGVDSSEKRLFGRSAYIKKDPELLEVAFKKKAIERKLMLERGLTKEETIMLKSKI